MMLLKANTRGGEEEEEEDGGCGEEEKEEVEEDGRSGAGHLWLCKQKHAGLLKGLNKLSAQI